MTLANRYTSSSHSVYNLGYHIVFCPKYRRKVLVDGVDERLKELLMEKAKELDIIIESMEVMPDHVHLFIRSKPTYAVHFVESVGHISEDTVMKYIENQKNV